MFTYFSIASANKVLPTVIEKFKKILKQKDEVIKIEQELEASLVTLGTFENYVILKQKLSGQYYCLVW
ncbi:MAG: hypothetical protein HYZ56_02265 [Nitrosopumilales archaeon]|nr:hypothetical protein [Nitrosopumilales archaeon]